MISVSWKVYAAAVLSSARFYVGQFYFGSLETICKNTQHADILFYVVLFFFNYGHLVEIWTKMGFGELTSIYLQRQTASFVHIKAVPRHTVIQYLAHNHQCVRLCAGLKTLKCPVPTVNYAVSRAIYVWIFWGTAEHLDCWSHKLYLVSLYIYITIGVLLSLFPFILSIN